MCTSNSWTVSGPDTPDPLLPPTTTDQQNAANQAIAPALANNRIFSWRRLPFPYIVIFGSGVICSLVCMVVLNGLLPNSMVRKTLTPHSLPDGHFLQVRDEFRVLYPQADGWQRQQGQMAKEKKKSPRGIGLLKCVDCIILTHICLSFLANQQEALSSLKVAMEFRAAGKDDKAMRLFKHALALAPRNPDVLTNYGEYLEHNRNDILLADLMYTQALAANPDHQLASMNRQRTASIVEALDLDRLAELDSKRDAISAIHESNAALRRTKKEAYFQNIYHSVGIEGNTMTLSQTRSVLETRMAVHGKSIDEHNEILGLDAAMKYINATLVNQSGFITMNDILEIHKRVLGHVDPIEGGHYRRTQVYVGGHVPPGPGDLTNLMGRFEQWLNSPQAQSMHPVRLSALAHYKLVHIHPFIDGNGRTSRLLMNTILMRSGYPPVIIPKHQRHKYYDFLQLANEGDTRPFVRFIADCTDKTLDLFLWATGELPHLTVPLLAQPEDSQLDEGGADEDLMSGSGGAYQGILRMDVDYT